MSRQSSRPSKRRGGLRAAPPPLPADCATWLARKQAEWAKNPGAIPLDEEYLHPEVIRSWMNGEAKYRLGPYIVRGPDYAGEYDAHCVFHDDLHASMRINFGKGVWHCFVCGSGRIEWLMDCYPESWLPPHYWRRGG